MPISSPAHPGIFLREVMGEQITVSALALHLGVTRANLSRILNGRLNISALTAIKLSEAFPAWEPDFWMLQQARYDVAQVMKERRTKLKPFPVQLSSAA